MKLYIANTTKQHHLFYYNHPERGRRHPLIKAGTQVCLDGLNTEQIGLIVKQYDIYGIKNVAEMSRLHGFVGFSFSIDKPVPIEAMLSLYEINDKAMDLRAVERRREEAAAIQDGIAEDLHRRTGIDKELLRPEHLEVQNVEETDGSKPSISEGVEVGRTPDDSPRRARNRSVARA